METLLSQEMLLHALLREAPDFAGQTLGVGFRLSEKLREATPLAFLVKKEPELALPVYRFLHEYDCYFRLRTAIDRARARQGADDLMQRASQLLHGEEREAVLRLLVKKQQFLAGGQEAIDELAAAARTIRAKRIAESTARSLARMPTLGAEAILEHIELLWLSLPRARATRTLHLFFETLPLSNTSAWEGIAYRLSRFQHVPWKMGHVRAGKMTLAEAFRGETSNLKGLLLEAAFWHGPTWARWEKPLLDQAAIRARRLSRGGERFKAVLVSAPLRVIETGQEFLDGAILLVRPNVKEPTIDEAVLHIAIQMKAERKITVIRQITNDMRRQFEETLMGLRTQARDRDFLLVPASDAHDTTRIIVIPELPEATRVGSAPLGAEIIAVPTLLDAAQYDEVALFLLVATGNAHAAARAAR
jgi:hypothetical protein